MLYTTHRNFLQPSAAALPLPANRRLLHAASLHVPVGIQLYSVRGDLAKSFEPTLQTLASLGYTEVETAGYFNHSPTEAKAAFKNTGLHCPSAHYNFQLMITQPDENIAFSHELGLQHLPCPRP